MLFSYQIHRLKRIKDILVVWRGGFFNNFIVNTRYLVTY